MAILLGVGGHFFLKGEIGLGVIIAYLGYLRNIFQPVRDLVEKYNTFLSAYVSSERVVGILKEKGEAVNDPVGDGKFPSNFGIRFREVSLKYKDRPTYALEKVSFEVQAGRSLAIVGATGSGKSSIIRLLLKFYRADSGVIDFGGREIADWNRKELRSCIGMIHQDVYLFAGTLRENLTMGRMELLDADLLNSCKTAELWDLVFKRGGLDFAVFEGGSNLSLGEKQLINFARILSLDPKVLIFDEATSSMDRVLEQKVMRALSEVLAGRTTIAIAHRLSTIESCDQILVLEDGKVVECGTFECLREGNGAFQKFYNISVTT